MASRCPVVSGLLMSTPWISAPIVGWSGRTSSAEMSAEVSLRAVAVVISRPFILDCRKRRDNAAGPRSSLARMSDMLLTIADSSDQLLMPALWLRQPRPQRAGSRRDVLAHDSD